LLLSCRPFAPWQGCGLSEARPLLLDELCEAANHLTDDRYFDNLSGQQAYKCFACRLRKAE
jgi:hypothetical protein